eukprot:c5184_g1_i1.p1 GENE.c5184_g1_i1~~c5184_g1_i1.p1  ORF type:complete len:292 (-),score=49.18 c5184_g1_i1:16-891(-)
MQSPDSQPIMPTQTLYNILGVDYDATSEDIRRAFHQAARKHHPDKNMGDANSEIIFKNVAEAYSVLSDDNKRKMYDLFGQGVLEERMSRCFRVDGDSLQAGGTKRKAHPPVLNLQEEYTMTDPCTVSESPSPKIRKADEVLAGSVVVITAPPLTGKQGTVISFDRSSGLYLLLVQGQMVKVAGNNLTVFSHPNVSALTRHSPAMSPNSFPSPQSRVAPSPSISMSFSPFYSPMSVSALSPTPSPSPSLSPSPSPIARRTMAPLSLLQCCRHEPVQHCPPPTPARSVVCFPN